MQSEMVLVRICFFVTQERPCLPTVHYSESNKLVKNAVLILLDSGNNSYVEGHIIDPSLFKRVQITTGLEASEVGPRYTQ